MAGGVCVSRKESPGCIVHKTLQTHSTFQHFGSLTCVLKMYHFFSLFSGAWKHTVFTDRCRLLTSSQNRERAAEADSRLPVAAVRGICSRGFALTAECDAFQVLLEQSLKFLHARNKLHYHRGEGKKKVFRSSERLGVRHNRLFWSFADRDAV